MLAAEIGTTKINIDHSVPIFGARFEQWTEDGTACSFASEKGYVQIISRGKEEPSVKVHTKDGQEHVLK